MADENAVIRAMNRARDQVEDKLFHLMWAATFLQAALILWEAGWLARLSEFGIQLWGPDQGSWAGKVRATDVTSTLYLILQMSYMGKKEFLRWTKGVTAIVNIKAGSVLDDQEVARRILRGDVAIVFWCVLTLFCGLLYSASLISRMPSELIRTMVQVVGIYAFAATSKEYKKDKDRKPVFAPAGAPSLASSSPQPVVTRSPRQDPEDTAARILSLLGQKGPMPTAVIALEMGLSRSRAQQLLAGLIAEGKVIKSGSGPGVTYGKK